ncbi:hypothetical protein AB0J80_14975 [Actinoplanes sp. NPDC049548]|uniref:hypothetical protein n=1 Tax=Actinoplanes sp. NPDC049548 TaxID=3155152 RepID=UPI00343A0658
MSYPQNDPDRAGGLISDAQGEFVEEESGGAFDPRAFQKKEPPSDDDHMVGPGEEIEKAH